MADGEAWVYEARYGWDLKTTGVVAVSALFTVALLLPTPEISPYARVLGLPLFGVGGLLMTYIAMSRKVALRIDETGVLLGGTPVRYRTTTAHVPWQDITAVVHWRQPRPADIPWVGVVRRPGAAPLTGPGQGRRARATMQILVPHLPADVVLASRAVNGWRLDRARLAAAVAHFAPGTPVTDVG
ncbi:hypothetical protein ACFU5O_22505 [Streptomyces sp. NPDC057445]|uniref:hypothetical protein n=1 Tax=Streptomyces sp. NPDC057445 TaxID=3346136 RepID=UPI00367AE986